MKKKTPIDEHGIQLEDWTSAFTHDLETNWLQRIEAIEKIQGRWFHTRDVHILTDIPMNEVCSWCRDRLVRAQKHHMQWVIEKQSLLTFLRERYHIPVVVDTTIEQSGK